MKKAKLIVDIIILALFIAAAIWVLAFAPSANAGPQCTYTQPYPDSPFNICTGFGQICPRSVCAYEPGTPGRFDINGDYEPRVG